ncbi:hypothetical protein [Mycolicibacterium mucogenicum]|uniref:Uncharacterized protein n=1 Tax=Mycolicibacterium mucogenicum DSM 44124 TaxID=1226753 RepID=A0A8E4R3I7_MYCMU|nr:hypothetical protein [Mycolicibacterium mucogenicum]KAB7756369.1 hypothetical protein MMUC44124_16755 [Mycolicibacterium mucogenicum DSM 44124]QPG67094.1 hypothetical protein C1S78_015955 [Mycolicibacterium mucogenicum DSM 44124]
MKITVKHFAPWLAAVAAIGALTLAPVAGADRDETNQSGGALDQPL